MIQKERMLVWKRHHPPTAGVLGAVSCGDAVIPVLRGLSPPCRCDGFPIPLPPRTGGSGGNWMAAPNSNSHIHDTPPLLVPHQKNRELGSPLDHSLAMGGEGGGSLSTFHQSVTLKKNSQPPPPGGGGGPPLSKSRARGSRSPKLRRLWQGIGTGAPTYSLCKLLGFWHGIRSLIRTQVVPV